MIECASPVPGDLFLTEDDFLFTDFESTRYESFDSRVFEQDIWWVNIKREAFRLEEMSNEYLENVLRHCYENLNHFHMKATLRHRERLLLKDHNEFDPVKQEAFIGFLNQLMDPQSLPPGLWLIQTPLIQRITQILLQRA